MGECAIAIANDASAGRLTATIAGEMTIMYACQVRDALLELFSADDRLRIDVSGVTEIDLTGLQLLCAAHRAAFASGKNLTVEWDGNDSFEASIREAGFPRHVGCADDKQNSCIWVGGN